MNKKELANLGEQVTKPKRKRPDLSEKQSVHTNPGDNSKYITHSLELMSLGKVDMSDNNQVEQRCVEYLRICAKNDMKPSVEALALALGIDRRTLWAYRVGERGKNPVVVDTLKKYSQFINTQMVDYMLNNKIQPLSGMFLIKNNFEGYQDETKVTVKAEAPLGDIKDTKELEDRYVESVVDADNSEKK